MKTSNINSRQEAVTRDIKPGETVMQSFNFTGLGVTVEAMTMDEALIKAKAVIKSKQN